MASNKGLHFEWQFVSSGRCRTWWLDNVFDRLCLLKWIMQIVLINCSQAEKLEAFSEERVIHFSLRLSIHGSYNLVFPTNCRWSHKLIHWIVLKLNLWYTIFFLYRSPLLKINIAERLFRGYPRDQGKCPLNIVEWRQIKYIFSFILPRNLL